MTKRGHCGWKMVETKTLTVDNPHLYVGTKVHLNISKSIQAEMHGVLSLSTKLSPQNDEVISSNSVITRGHFCALFYTPVNCGPSSLGLACLAPEPWIGLCAPTMVASERSTDVILDSDGQFGLPSGKLFLSRVN